MDKQHDETTAKEDCYERAHDISIGVASAAVGGAAYETGGISLLKAGEIFATTQAGTNEIGKFFCDNPLSMGDTDGAYALGKLGVVDPDSTVGRDFLKDMHLPGPTPGGTDTHPPGLDGSNAAGVHDGPVGSFDWASIGLHQDAWGLADVGEPASSSTFDDHLATPDSFTSESHPAWDTATLPSGIVVHLDPTSVTDRAWESNGYGSMHDSYPPTLEEPAWMGASNDPTVSGDASLNALHQDAWSFDDHTGSSNNDGSDIHWPDPFAAGLDHGDWSSDFTSGASDFTGFDGASFDGGSSHDGGTGADAGGDASSVAD